MRRAGSHRSQETVSILCVLCVSRFWEAKAQNGTALPSIALVCNVTCFLCLSLPLSLRCQYGTQRNDSGASFMSSAASVHTDQVRDPISVHHCHVHFFGCCLFTDVVSSSVYKTLTDWTICEPWIGKEWEEAVAPYFKALCRHLPAGYSGNRRCSGWDLNPGHPEYEAGVLPIWPRRSEFCDVSCDAALTTHCTCCLSYHGEGELMNGCYWGRQTARRNNIVVSRIWGSVAVKSPGLWICNGVQFGPSELHDVTTLKTQTQLYYIIFVIPIFSHN